jgi:hypothetical protein
MLGGGGAFNHLDYSFAVGHEDGTAANTAPGGGSAALRHQLATLRRVLQSTDLPRMRPDPDVVVHASGVVPRALSDRRTTWLVYLDGQGPSTIVLHLPRGAYAIEWLDPAGGGVTPAPAIRAESERVTITSPAFAEDLVLHIATGS